MNLLYNSDQFAVLQIEWPETRPGAVASAETPLARGGYEIVDKLARKGLFIQGLLAQQFRDGVQALVDGEPDAEVLDDYIGRYTELAQQPMVTH